MSAIILRSRFTVTPANARGFTAFGGSGYRRSAAPTVRAGRVCLLIDRLEPSTGAITTVTTRYRQRDQVGHVRTASERSAATRAGPENERVPSPAVSLSSVYSMLGKSENDSGSGSRRAISSARDPRDFAEAEVTRDDEADKNEVSLACALVLVENPIRARGPR